MSDPNDLAAFLAQAWQHLGRGVADRRAPARYPTFATVSPEGIPQARTVALRAASSTAGTLEVHTDIATDKVAALRHNPVAALHIWIPRSDLQIRVTTQVAILTGEAVEAQWRQIPEGSRVSYGTVPDPGAPIASVYDYEKPANRTRFAVLECTVTAFDLVHLGTQHRRAAFVRADGWAGQWVAP
ncbi:pyridoxamine 5'-phosphate oxidase family protein [Sulfitobacter guttiformis]|uniref:Pyridoxamine 5'-phosphate oxidase-like protein n=1 Tax=Sulfitobacter guttiformis TaxID=74349 RepID=A0A420DP40_9RHOB|nr:pyridoxamine 5'-phosphate oxidase family protein [Sulfitobacter guttiformis]KIN73365.1 Pyridoxamine 5'-phosphate oxidase-related, FMN-binding [Sulfitobacter guttiformis KCTC 32187]RKE96031.1 pyridoxamine 5'-phosphate oxidase-like protein [Sulfitobacter guttiformis]